jgi:hypothetical protein
MHDGAEVLVPGEFNVTIDEHGDTLMHPLGDRSNPPSARMPRGGYFFDAIIRQPPIDEDHLNPADNLEEYGPMSEEELAHLEREARRAAGTRRCVAANFGGTAFRVRFNRGDEGAPSGYRRNTSVMIGIAMRSSQGR